MLTAFLLSDKYQYSYTITIEMVNRTALLVSMVKIGRSICPHVVIFPFRLNTLIKMILTSAFRHHLSAKNHIAGRNRTLISSASVFLCELPLDREFPEPYEFCQIFDPLFPWASSRFHTGSWDKVNQGTEKARIDLSSN